LSAEIVRINKEQPEASLITYVAEQLKAGQVLGMPTDTSTVWPPTPSICAR
jgi:tRNA A37 threonylcarbamoyladenosine synthetase subunit TsaC/SUA5/YrdC